MDVHTYILPCDQAELDGRAMKYENKTLSISSALFSNIFSYGCFVVDICCQAKHSELLRKKLPKTLNSVTNRKSYKMSDNVYRKRIIIQIATTATVIIF